MSTKTKQTTTAPKAEFQGHTWSKVVIEAHYRREGSELWYVCKVQRGNEFVSKVSTTKEAEDIITEWAKMNRATRMDCGGLTISFPPNTARYEFRIVRTKSESETLKHIAL